MRSNTFRIARQRLPLLLAGLFACLHGVDASASVDSAAMSVRLTLAAPCDIAPALPGMASTRTVSITCAPEGTPLLAACTASRCVDDGMTADVSAAVLATGLAEASAEPADGVTLKVVY